MDRGDLCTERSIDSPMKLPMNRIFSGRSATRRKLVSGGPSARTLCVLAALLAAVSGCSTGRVPEGHDPQADMLDAKRQLNERQIALEQAVQEVDSGQRDPIAMRESLKQLMWKGSAPDPVRIRALHLLLQDQRPEMLADTRNMLRLRLPTESSWALLDAIADVCVANASDDNWKELTAGLVRSYSRRVPQPTDDQRPEKRALEALHPGKTLDTIAYAVFTDPVGNGATTKIPDWEQKSREAAWELLSRLDPDGAKRASLLAADTSKDPNVRDLAKCARELGVVPVTGSELAWVQRLVTDKNPGNAAWWREASAAVQGLSQEQRAGLQLRHLEPVRWAAAHQSEWLRAGREELASMVGQRLESRRIWRMTEGLGNDKEISREAFRERQSELCWGDLLSILVIDGAIHDPAIVNELFTQADADQADDGAEYGGVLSAGSTAGKQSAFVVRAFPPRPTQRVNDRTFVAPEDMFNASDRALAHFHFHVQTSSNGEYAGPGKGDLEYAYTHGRNCLVLTSVKSGVMDVDYYQRNGAIIDLGEVSR